MYFSLKSNHAKWWDGESGRWCHSTVIPGKKSQPMLFRKPSQRTVNNLLSCVPGFHQIAALNLSVPGHRHAWHYRCVFYLWCVAGIQNSKSWRAWQGVDLLPSCRVEICSTLLTILYQKDSCTRNTQWLESIVIHSEKLWPNYLPSAHTCPLLLNSCSMAPSVPFDLGKAKYPLSNVIQDGEQSLPVLSRKSPHCGILWEPYAFLFPTPSPLRLLGENGPSPPQHHGFSLPQFASLNLASATFSPSNWADYFLNPQMNFLCSKWLDVDLAVFEGWDKLRVPLLLHHLNYTCLCFILFGSYLIYLIKDCQYIQSIEVNSPDLLSVWH